MKVIYNADTGHFDGLIKGKIYKVIDESVQQFEVANELGGSSWIQKSKFIIQETTSQNEKWTASTDDEHFSNEAFNTKEEAIQFGIDQYSDYCDWFYVGQIEEVKLERIVDVDLDSILERIAESAYEIIGEVAEDYLYNVNKEAFEDIEKAITDVLVQKLIEHELKPTFYRISNVERIDI